MRIMTWSRVAVATLTAMVGSAYGWEIGEPIVTYWAGPGYSGSNMPIDDAHVKQLKEGAYNVLWAQTKADLDMAAKWGMRALYHLPTARGKGWSEATRTKLAKTIAAIKDHPALYFYHQCDEPPAGWYEYLNADKEFVRSLDPNHPCWVNLLPTYANNKQLGVPGEIISAYWEHVRRFMDVYDPEFTSYDHYQLCNGYDMDDYFLNLAIVQQNAAARGIPFMNGVQTCTWWPNGSLASPSAPRIPNVDELRYLVYTTLAYGAQGIYYYVYSHPGHKGSIVEQDGTISEKYYALQKLNPIFVATAKETRGFRMSGAFFRGFCPHGGTPYGARALLKFKDDVTTVDLPHHAAPTNSILVTRFDAPGRGTRLMVVNLDYRRARTLSLTAPTDAESFDPVSRSWRPLGKTFELSLDKGEGVLLRLADGPASPCPERRQM